MTSCCVDLDLTGGRCSGFGWVEFRPNGSMLCQPGGNALGTEIQGKMSSMSKPKWFLNLKNLAHLIGPVPEGLISVLETGLANWDADTGVPTLITNHNRKNTFTVPASFNKDMVKVAPIRLGRGAEFLILPNASHGKDTLFVLQMEPPAVPRRTHLELALRYLIRSAKSLDATFTVYLHSIISKDGTEYVYYGITSRSPFVRFHEHLAASRRDSHLLFHRALRDIVPTAKQIHHTIIAAGLSQDQAYDAEEYLVDKYSLASKHVHGLNMLPGGHEGLRQMHLLGVSAAGVSISADDREQALESYIASGGRKGIPNQLIAMRWDDDEYAEAVICGRVNRLSANAVRRIRWLAITGNSIDEIRKDVGAISEKQVKSVLDGKTYTRIK